MRKQCYEYSQPICSKNLMVLKAFSWWNQCLLKSGTPVFEGMSSKVRSDRLEVHTEDYSGQAETTWDDCVNLRMKLWDFTS